MNKTTVFWGDATYGAIRRECQVLAWIIAAGAGVLIFAFAVLAAAIAFAPSQMRGDPDDSDSGQKRGQEE